MSVIGLSEMTLFFRSYGLKCDQKNIEEWMIKTNWVNKNEVKQLISEDDLYDFNEWNRWEGTAYEAGIDDETKINRLLEEIRDLKLEIKKLGRD
jgi:hypothetical protein